MKYWASSSTHKATSQAEAEKEDQDHGEAREKEVAEDEHDLESQSRRLHQRLPNLSQGNGERAQRPHLVTSMGQLH